MKNTVILLLCLLTMQYSMSQNVQGFYRMADSLYTAKDYGGAARAYNAGIKIQGAFMDVNRYLSASSSWALANEHDSAFFLLDRMSQFEKLVTSDVRNLENSKELSVLHTDKRWKGILANIKKRAAANTYQQNELVYGRKDGLALMMAQLKPKVKPNGRAIIRVLAGSWYSSFSWVERSVYYTRKYLDRGYTVFMVVLGSQPRYAIPDQVADLKRAVRYIRYNSGQLGIDPERIGIEGGSAAGHLSLIIATADEKTDSNAADPIDKVSSRVQAVAALFPPTDFFNWGASGLAMINVKEALLQNRVYGAFDFTAWNNSTSTYDRITDSNARNKIGREISPIYAVSSDDPPVFIIHGDSDRTVPLQQSEIFIARLKEVGVMNNFIIKKGGKHSEDDMSPETSQFADWFDKHLK